MDFNFEHQRSSLQVTFLSDCVAYLALSAVAWYVLLRNPCICVLLFWGQKGPHCNFDTSAKLPSILFSNVSILTLEV